MFKNIIVVLALIAAIPFQIAIAAPTPASDIIARGPQDDSDATSASAGVIAAPAGSVSNPCTMLSGCPGATA